MIIMLDKQLKSLYLDLPFLKIAGGKNNQVNFIFCLTRTSGTCNFRDRCP